MRKPSKQLHFDNSSWMQTDLDMAAIFDDHRQHRSAVTEAQDRSKRHFMARVSAWNRRYIGEQAPEGELRRSVREWANRVAIQNPPKDWTVLDRDQAREARNRRRFPRTWPELREMGP